METSFRLWTAEASRPSARLASSGLSTFPQPCSSTASQRLTSLFAESIHRPIHRTLALHTRDWRDRSALSCWPWAPVQRSTCPPSLPSRLPPGQQPSAHARLSDEVSDNRHGQQWTSTDIRGRCAAGRARCGAGSPYRYLGSGRRGRLTADLACRRIKGQAGACPDRARAIPSKGASSHTAV